MQLNQTLAHCVARYICAQSGSRNQVCLTGAPKEPQSQSRVEATGWPGLTLVCVYLSSLFEFKADTNWLATCVRLGPIHFSPETRRA